MENSIRGKSKSPRLRALLASGALVACLGLAAPAAYAGPISINASIGGVPTSADAYENFDLLPLGSAGGSLASGIDVSFVADGQAVTGAVDNRYAAPFLSGNNGLNFGNVPANGADESTYITSGLGQAILDFPTLERYMGILWGSVDPGNVLTFYLGGVEQGSIKGTDVTALAHGDQGADGTFYVNINTPFQFDRVIATSNEYAFEFDNVAFSAHAIGVPEPSEFGLFLLGLLLVGSGFWYRKRALA